MLLLLCVQPLSNNFAPFLLKLTTLCFVNFHIQVSVLKQLHCLLSLIPPSWHFQRLMWILCAITLNVHPVDYLLKREHYLKKFIAAFILSGISGLLWLCFLLHFSNKRITYFWRRYFRKFHLLLTSERIHCKTAIPCILLPNKSVRLFA